MVNTLVSVIVPCYKSEKFIKRCIESLIQQTYENIQIVLVDDGSPDSTGIICDRYSKEDSRIVVIHQSNKGVNSARKEGVAVSVGDWIVFVDPDDYLPLTSVEDFTKNIDDDIDIIVGSFNGKQYDNTIVPIEEYKHKIILCSEFHGAPWAHMYRRKLFNDFVFEMSGIKKGQDLLMNIRLAFNAKKNVKTIASKTYNYCVNEDGTISTFNHTIEYESNYQKYRLQSIPQEVREEYMNDIILSMINGLKYVSVSNSSSTVWMRHPYYNRVISLIVSYNVKMGFMDRCLIFVTNPICRKFIIAFYELQQKVYYKLKAFHI